MKILFVCTGNTCRSSMAEALARKALQGLEEGGREFRVFSAGVAAWPGDKASWGAVEALAELGIDLSGHSANLLTPDDLQEADLVLTMTAGHREAVRKMAPSMAEKVFTLAEYAGAAGDIPDPVGQPLEVYRRCARRLEGLIKRVLDRLNK